MGGRDVWMESRHQSTAADRYNYLTALNKVTEYSPNPGRKRELTRRVNHG